MEYTTVLPDNISTNDKLGIIYGSLSKDEELFKVTERLRTKDHFTYLKRQKDDTPIIHPVHGNISYDERRQDLKLGEELARKFIKQKFNIQVENAVSIESSYIEAPNSHNFDEIHADEDNFGVCITFILYVNVDETIIGGNLKIFSIDSTTAQMSIDPKAEQMSIDPKAENSESVKFVLMDGSVKHQVEYVNGVGVREAVIYFFYY